MNEGSTQLCELTINGQPLVALPEAPAKSEARGVDGLITRRLKVMHDIFAPRVTARGVPFEFVLEVTARCNLLCPMCPRSVPNYMDAVPDQDMDMDTFHRVLDRVRDVATLVWFTGRGEPMMNKHFMRMIREFREAGVAVGVSTNGTFLTPKQQERILDTGLDYLIVSFDGADKETFEKIRIGADFEKVRDNVRSFAALKIARKMKDPWLVLQMIEMAPNRGQDQAFKKLWNLPGIDAVRIKDEQLQFDKSMTFEGQRKRLGKKPCMNLWRGTPMVQWDGTMLPCCFGPADKAFGNLKHAGLDELWNSSRIKNLRASHLAGCGLTEDYCKNCNAIEPGKLLLAASAVLPILWQKKNNHHVEQLNRWVRFL